MSGQWTRASWRSVVAFSIVAGLAASVAMPSPLLAQRRVVVVPGAGGPQPAGVAPGVVVLGPGRQVLRRPPQGIRVPLPPPAPQAQTWSAPQAPGEVWIDGFWGWTGSAWEWVAGHWEAPPAPGALWNAPRFVRNTWVPGHWSMPQLPGGLPTAVPNARPYQLGVFVSGVLTMQDPRDAGGGPFHDYAVALQRGAPVTFVAVGGPADQRPGQRLSLTLQVLWNGQVIAQDFGSPGVPDARVDFVPPQQGAYVVRVAARSAGMHAVMSGTYVLESGGGGWAAPQNPFDLFWGPQQAVPQVVMPQPPMPQPRTWAPPVAPRCRDTILELGHDGSSMMFCDDVEPFCADALLRAGHDPSALIHCGGVEPQCAVTMMRQGRSPAELVHCQP